MTIERSTAPNVRDRRKWPLVVWPYLAAIALLLVLGATNLKVMTGLRALAGAESHRSMSQKLALGHLDQYAQTRAEQSYRLYLAQMPAAAGWRSARIALDKPNPDFDLARRGLRDAGIDPDDVESIIGMFRWFRTVGFMESTMALWTEADMHVAGLDAAAQALHAGMAAGKTPIADLQAPLARVRAIDGRLARLDESFAATLDGASRQTSELFALTIVAAAAALVVLAILRIRSLARDAERFEIQLRTSEERFEYAVIASNDGIWDWSLRSDELFFSPRFEEMLGHEPGTMRDTAAAFLRRIHPRDRRSAATLLRQHLGRGDPFDLEFRIRMRDGAFRWFRTRGRSVLGPEGKPQRMAGSLTDITDRKLAEAQIFQEKERAQVTLASIADAVITVDMSGRIEFMNAVAERLTGWDDARARGKEIAAVFTIMDETTGLERPDPVAHALRERCTVKSERNVVLRRRGDAPVAIDHGAAPIRNRVGDVVGAVLVFHDMSRERDYAARLTHLATHDPLTGLLNRREFERRLGMTLADDQREPFHHALLYLDLDQFKLVNDTCGHAAGDELLRQISGLLRPFLREGDTLARLGGDEFGVLLEHCTPDPAIRIAETLRAAVAKFHFVWKNRSFNGSVSVGLVNIADGPRTLAGVLSAADAACYMAKDKGRNRIQVYSPDSTEVTARHGQMEWVTRIQRALAENRFCLFAQPVCPTRGNRAARPYTELLLRLRDENGELIPPAEFISAAERYNLMPAIDRWVITTAFAIFAQSRDVGVGVDGGAPSTIAINLSGASIGDDDFLDFVRGQFTRFAIPHSSICFEITETTAVTSLSRATEFMAALREQGCRFALDDFGVGVSSFTYLKNLPVDFVKIDGSFVVDMLQNPVNHAMVEAIHNIGRILGKKTIAESVESPEILDALGEIGVDFAQGYAIARPEIFGQLRRPRALQSRAAAA